MCGICGIANSHPDMDVPQVALVRMCERLRHRGPDGHGIRNSSGVGLGHARLSIIDVVGGAQPLCNEDGSVWVTYNGEIYNYHELMDRLKAAGHQFRTRSDTEVLVHLYEEVGLGFVKDLNGMFAFALHDERRGRVILARDHFGIKPLFYSIQGGRLVFGSEIKAVLAGLERSRATTTEAVQEYLLFRCCSGDRTFFDGIQRLPPGTVGVWEGGHLTVRPFWDPPAPVVRSTGSLEEEATRLESYLEGAVRSQMMSEVPLGTFCSGGVDSGLVSAYAARASSHPLHTFSVGFRDPKWDESTLARDTAARIASQHHVLVADHGAFQEALPDLIWHYDEPLSHPNSVLIALLSAYARERVTVVLTGEGADELFGGYPRHHIARLNAIAGKWPAWMRRGGAHLLKMFGGRKGGLLGAHLPLQFPEAIVMNSAFVSPQVVQRLTGATPRNALEIRMATAEALMVPGDPFASISRYDQRTYLPCLLDRMDRMTMSSGVEGRVPFLDIRLAEWASGLPTRYRLGPLHNKRVVKRLAQRYLSRRVTHGPKSGFGVPVGDWLRMPEWSDNIARLLDVNHPASTVVDPVEVRALVQAHMKRVPGLSDILWLLLNLYRWHEIASDA
jgi:asparagine synthase (glutamine-hydrolysing)